MCWERTDSFPSHPSLSFQCSTTLASAIRKGKKKPSRSNLILYHGLTRAEDALIVGTRWLGSKEATLIFFPPLFPPDKKNFLIFSPLSSSLSIIVIDPAFNHRKFILLILREASYANRYFDLNTTTHNSLGSLHRTLSTASLLCFLSLANFVTIFFFFC